LTGLEIICEIHDSEMDSIVPEIVNLMQWNTLEIPLFVDKEVCLTSWANKIDYEDWAVDKNSDVENYIDWS
jgi:hypothetical protein